MKGVNVYFNIVYVLGYLLFSRNRPTEVVIGEKSGPGPHCPRCLRTVYDAERAIGLNDVSTKLVDHTLFSSVIYS